MTSIMLQHNSTGNSQCVCSDPQFCWVYETVTVMSSASEFGNDTTLLTGCSTFKSDDYLQNLDRQMYVLAIHSNPCKLELLTCSSDSTDRLLVDACSRSQH